MSIKVVGLTGGIACGKSTLAGFLRERGVPVVDADEVARAVVAPGRDAHAEIVAAFGQGVVAPDGAIDRRALAARVFADPQTRKRLEAITHPRILEESERRFRALEAAGERVVVYEAALLVETGRHMKMDALVVVSCAPEVQERRLVAQKGFSPEDARARIAAQRPLAEKEAVADVVVRNDGTLDEARAATHAAWREVERRLAQDGAP
jgi:dephospho-CoA kinase